MIPMGMTQAEIASVTRRNDITQPPMCQGMRGKKEQSRIHDQQEIYAVLQERGPEAGSAGLLPPPYMINPMISESTPTAISPRDHCLYRLGVSKCSLM